MKKMSLFEMALWYDPKEYARALANMPEEEKRKQLNPRDGDPDPMGALIGLILRLNKEGLMQDLLFVAGLVLIVILLVAWNRLILVPAGYVVVTRGWNNQIVRVLKEGFHVLAPLENVARFSWTFTDQNYETEGVEGYQIRVAGIQQMDMVPIECETADNVIASVDTLLVWKVQDPQKAMSVSHDPLNLLCQQVIRGIRRETTKYKRNVLTRHEEEIAAAACSTIAKEWTPTYGLEIVKCEIQNISFDEDTIRRRRQFRDGLDPYERSRIEQAHALSTSIERKRTQINL